MKEHKLPQNAFCRIHWRNSKNTKENVNGFSRKTSMGFLHHQRMNELTHALVSVYVQ